jgi:2-keto-4-pentenoate hydratase/2-oxohepta-3-ene-1,7-dioic acid hydratase in catechol pathway
MYLANVMVGTRAGLAARIDGDIRVAIAPDIADLDTLLRNGDDALHAGYLRCAEGELVAESDLRFLPPIRRPSKIVCVGLNYRDHAEESGFVPPDFPTLFARFPSGLIGHGDAILKPSRSELLDFEGELAAVIGRPGRDIAIDCALNHIAGYSVFNDGSVRDYQMKTTQWMAGKNFDATGGFGPWFVTADELPPGASGLKLETRLNGDVVQSASTADMIFDVATLVSILSSFMTLETGDVIVTGTPAGVGFARKPPLYMQDGDVCEVEIERVGLLRNPILA